MALGQVRRAALYPAELRVHPDMFALLDDQADRINGEREEYAGLCVPPSAEVTASNLVGGGSVCGMSPRMWRACGRGVPKGGNISHPRRRQA